MNLKDFLNSETRAAIAFSGGVDSSYLLYAAKKNGADVTAYYVRTAFQPEFEYKDAARLADELGIRMKTIGLDIFRNEDIVSNPKNRCYFCKRMILGEIKKHAADDGYKILMEGTNASDDAGDRPGMAAIEELSVLSPLRECGLTKADVRRLSKEAGLFTWNKPSYSCLATRVMNCERITPEKLSKIDAAEGKLFELGLSDLRVRVHGNNALLQLRADDINRAFDEREKICGMLSEYFDIVALDLKERENKEKGSI